MSIVNEIFQDMTDEEYFSLSGYYSHSLLARYKNEGLGCLLPLDKSKSLAIGSLVDTLITAPNQIDLFHVIDNLSDKDVEIIYELRDQKKKLGRNLTDDDIIDVINKLDWRKTWKNPTRIQYVREIYDPIKDMNFEYIISSEMFANAKRCVETLYTCDATKDIFADCMTRVYQGVILGDIKTVFDQGFSFKARSKFDIVCIDETNKKIYPYDLKTTSKKEWEFIDSFFKYGYDIQASIYTTLLKQKVDEIDTKGEWSIEPFRFIVVNTETPDPIVYKFEPPLTGTGFRFKPDGYHELIDPAYLVEALENDIKESKRNSRPFSWRGQTVIDLNSKFKMK